MVNTEARCLVIGANGFIGSHLVDELVQAGFKVRAFDRFSRPPQFEDSENVEVIAGDFFDDLTVSKVLKDVDFVFHSFSATNPATADADPYTDISLNVMRNIQLFEKCVEAEVKKIIFISSGGAVYGNVAERQSVSEQDVPSPVSPYGIGKLTSEYYLGYFNRKYELDYAVYRLSNPYGPRQITKNNQGVIPTFITKITEEQPLTVVGDGTSSRDYIYIRDATSMIVAAFQAGKHKVYNLGSGQQTAIRDIITSLEDVLGKTASLTYIDEPKTFLAHSGLNVDRFTEEFKLTATTTLPEGLRKTVEATGKQLP